MISTIHQLSPAPLRTVLALFTHTAPHMVNSRSIRYAVQFRCHRFPASVNGRCFLTPLYHVWSPSLRRHYPPSSVLLNHPTPCAIFAFLPLQLSGILPFQEESTGSPGLPCNHNVKHAMVSDPGEASIFLPIAKMPVLTSTSITVSSFPSRRLRGSIPSTLRLTAYLLAVLRLKSDVAISPPRTRYPVAGQPSGAGYPPAGSHDLARPHNRTVPIIPSPLFHYSSSLVIADE